MVGADPRVPFRVGVRVPAEAVLPRHHLPHLRRVLHENIQRGDLQLPPARALREALRRNHHKYGLFTLSHSVSSSFSRTVYRAALEYGSLTLIAFVFTLASFSSWFMHSYLVSLRHILSFIHKHCLRSLPSA